MWLKSVVPIALIFSFRMLGLFMLIPVFTIYALKLDYATPLLIGVALGGYGLTQGLLQIPFGMLSDKFGRKPLIATGLVLLTAGSLMGAFAESIYAMIFARFLQGMGAVGSVLIALLADLTPVHKRTGAMAVVGVSIGLSVSLAMVLSPVIANFSGLKGIFLFTAALGLIGLLFLYAVVPNPENAPIPAANAGQLFKRVLQDKSLLLLDFGIFVQHYLFTATFFVIPLLLKQFIQQGHLLSQWHFYLPLMLFSFLAMVPFIVFAERRHKARFVFILSIVMILAAQWGLASLAGGWQSFCVLMFVYFVAFNILEASLPASVSKVAEADSKGTAMGVYSSSQFLGIFIGGLMAGIIYQYGGQTQLFFWNGAVCLLWLLLSIFLSDKNKF